jgi:hypothetical protein
LRSIPGDPATALATAAVGASELVRDLVHAINMLLQSAEFEWLGEPGQVLTVELPKAGYCLDAGVPPAHGDTSSGRFRVVRRGVRLRGIVLVPTALVPAVEDCL